MTDTEPAVRADPTARIDPETGQTILKADSSQGFLRTVPLLLGMRPENSVVLVLFRGTRTHGAMRIDLPPHDDPTRLRDWATEVVGLVCKVNGADGVAPVVYTSDTFAPDGRLPRAAVLRALDRRAEQAGLVVKNLLCVAADGWGSNHDPDLPRGGRPLDEILPPIELPRNELRHGVVPEFADATEAGSRAFWTAVRQWCETVGGPLAADRGPLHGVDLRRKGAGLRWSGGTAALDRFRFGEDVDQLLDLVEASLEPHDHDPDRPCPCRALLYCLARRPGLPNLVLIQIGWGRAAARRLWLAANAGDRKGTRKHRLVAYLCGSTTERPDADRIEAATRALLEIGAYVPKASRPNVDAMLAWLHWAIGAANVAGRLAGRALDVDPEQELAQNLRLLARRPPEWAFGEPDLAAPA